MDEAWLRRALDESLALERRFFDASGAAIEHLPCEIVDDRAGA